MRVAKLPCWRQPEVLAAQHYQTITRMLGELASGGTLEAPEDATGVVLITGLVLGCAASRGDAPRLHPVLPESSSELMPCSAPMFSLPISARS
jgi:hypothetical protein